MINHKQKSLATQLQQELTKRKRVEEKATEKGKMKGVSGEQDCWVTATLILINQRQVGAVAKSISNMITIWQ